MNYQFQLRGQAYITVNHTNQFACLCFLSEANKAFLMQGQKVELHNSKKFKGLNPAE